MTRRLSEADQQFIQEQAQMAAALLRMMSNHQRLLILCLLIQFNEMHVSEIHNNTNLSQSALSQHLAKLREAGLVATRREAQTIYYRIDDPAIMDVVATLRCIYSPQSITKA